ncbi:MAG: hypothetical protein CO094_02580 [Anaerolineae bacterium CG_4_9_14_3_um_filter_57_17]|nr:DUF1573 domain-containing protein [bacterium]NCT20204.1 DUF1573 domain-containing protein [bacterium]OIO86966.1 MAG: hypothetical protein AUK01_01495 [Anaerolineae bacterium CG2_30_57_67]PJB67927.1 MAG: hypothetical protein CO094_02580 [Anaerolineae bacterium CG_4_9_14_3_um_filter_57_17]
MNKRKRKQPTKLSTPLIAFVIGGALLVAVAIFFTRGGSDGGGTPKLVVDQEKIDYGDVKFGVNKTFAIKVTNTGDGVLRFKEKPYIQVLEGC